ncbi:MAG: hypothetical protein J6P72_01260 [Firmicutes bacterium]|nr:hypothetical protein [Bacillota bacterium]
MKKRAIMIFILMASLMLMALAGCSGNSGSAASGDGKSQASQAASGSKTGETAKTQDGSKTQETSNAASQQEAAGAADAASSNSIDDPEFQPLFGGLAQGQSLAFHLVGLAYGQLDSAMVDPAIYASSLADIKSMKEVDLSEMPDGEQLIVAFSDSGIEYHFFSMSGSGNYVYKLDDHGIENLYKLELNDGTYTPYDIVSKWYDDLHFATEDTEIAPSTDLIGEWAEKQAGRGYISISLGPDDDSYAVFIQWSNSASESYTWSMLLTPTGDGSRCTYDNGICDLHAFDADGVETVTEVYTGGTGSFWINGDGELVWEDDMEHVADYTSFVRQ